MMLLKLTVISLGQILEMLMFKHILVILKLTEKSLMLIKTTQSIPVVGTVSYRKQHIIKLLLICLKDPKFGADRGQITCSLLEGKTLPII